MTYLLQSLIIFCFLSILLSVSCKTEEHLRTRPTRPFARRESPRLAKPSSECVHPGLVESFRFCDELVSASSAAWLWECPEFLKTLVGKGYSLCIGQLVCFPWGSGCPILGLPLLWADPSAGLEPPSRRSADEIGLLLLVGLLFLQVAQLAQGIQRLSARHGGASFSNKSTLYITTVFVGHSSLS